MQGPGPVGAAREAGPDGGGGPGAGPAKAQKGRGSGAGAPGRRGDSEGSKAAGGERAAGRAIGGAAGSGAAGRLARMPAGPCCPLPCPVGGDARAGAGLAGELVGGGRGRWGQTRDAGGRDAGGVSGAGGNRWGPAGCGAGLWEGCPCSSCSSRGGGRQAGSGVFPGAACRGWGCRAWRRCRLGDVLAVGRGQRRALAQGKRVRDGHAMRGGGGGKVPVRRGEPLWSRRRAGSRGGKAGRGRVAARRRACILAPGTGVPAGKRFGAGSARSFGWFLGCGEGLRVPCLRKGARRCTGRTGVSGRERRGTGAGRAAPATSGA